MLSKKVFLTGEKNFSAPLVHPPRADVRNHVESQEGDHRASYAFDRGLQKRRQPKTDFREIWGAAQFLTFSTASVKGSPRDYVRSTSGVPRIAADLTHRSTQRPWARRRHHTSRLHTLTALLTAESD